MSLSLSDRLAQYANLIAAVRHDSAASAPPPELDTDLEGLQRHEHSGGLLYCKTSERPLDEPFGEFAIDWDVSLPAPSLLPRFLADARETLPESWAFIDCETTGLSGGAGTMAFLIAVGRIVAGQFVIRQFFLPEPADEQALLNVVREALDGVRVLWTYNGKCFDIPLLESRFRFWRMNFSRDDFGHVDLLVPTRVLFRRRVEDCSLATVEERILKIARIEDLPGAEVPAVYFEYLRTGRSPRLHRVFEHNRVDVLSLAVYAAYLLNVFHPGRPERLRYPEDVLSLARYHVRHREWEAARQCLEDAERFALGPELEVEYHRLSAYLHKRRSDFERALPHLRALAEHLQADSIGALEDLAKYYEHRRREPGEALRLVDRAIALADRALMFGTIAAEPRLAGLYHRRARLRRKLLPKRTG